MVFIYCGNAQEVRPFDDYPRDLYPEGRGCASSLGTGMNLIDL
jgi:hypothetical protein